MFDTVAGEVAHPRRPLAAHYLAGFESDLQRRLQAGEHILLFGPRGTGKSALLAALRERLQARSIPCALAPQTAALADIVQVCAQAYPRTAIRGLDRRAMATRLRLTAERTPGVLLLDHLRELTNAMIGFLRRLRGGVLGALLCVDVDAPFERERVLQWRRHALTERMPLMPTRNLQRLLLQLGADYGLPPMVAPQRKQLLNAARGRAGWLSECLRQMREPQYWRGGQLHLAALCTDSEIALRHRPGPRLRRGMR
jgi:hypothetical protein